jgi:hypothetical protein
LNILNITAVLYIFITFLSAWVSLSHGSARVAVVVLLQTRRLAWEMRAK